MAKSFQDSLTDAQLMLISKAQKAGPDALSTPELEELSSINKRYKGYQEPEMTHGDAAMEVGKGALNVAGRVLDLPGGIVRTGVGAAAGVAGTDDLLQALVGNAPSTDTLLERGGVGEMGTYRMPIIGTEFTGRGAVGLLGDVASGMGASSGLKAAAKGTGLLAKTASVVRAPEAAIEAGMNAAGKGAYRSGMKKLDRAAELMGKGKNAVSDVLGKRNVWGGARSIQEGSDSVVNELQAKVDKAIAQATASGGTIDIDAALAPTRAEAQRLLASKGTQPFKAQVKSFINQVDDLSAQAKGAAINSQDAVMMGTQSAPVPYTPTDAQNVKQQIYGLLSDPAYNTLTSQPVGKQLMKQGVRGIKESIEAAAPGVKEMNAEIAPLLSAKKKIAQELTSEIGRNGVTSVDGALAGGNWLALLGKKTADVLKGTPARTGGGLLLQNATTQNLAKQALLESIQGERGQMDDNLNLVVERIRRKYGN